MNRGRGKFIVIEKTRIKIGNIKNYGISSTTIEYEKIYKSVEQSRKGLARLVFGNMDLVWEGETEKLTEDRRYELVHSSFSNYADERYDPYRTTAYKQYRNKEGEIVDSKSLATMDNSVIEKEVRYLYITTFQNDNFIFYEDEVDFDIIDKCSELDKLLSI